MDGFLSCFVSPRLFSLLGSAYCKQGGVGKNNWDDFFFSSKINLRDGFLLESSRGIGYEGIFHRFLK